MTLRTISIGLLLVAPLFAAAPACDPDNGGIKLPAGFCAFVAADGLGTARHMVAAANGDLYVALMDGGVMALRDTNGDGRFEMKEKFGSTSVTGIGLRNGYLYIATPNTVQRYKMTPGQLKPVGEPEIVVKDLPGVRQHGDKGLTFDGAGSLYVNVGAPSNACQVKDRTAQSPARTPAPSWKKMAASGSLMRTSSAKHKPTAPVLRPACAKCPPLPGTMAPSTSP